MSRVKGRAPITRQRSEWEQVNGPADIGGAPSEWFRRRIHDGLLAAIRSEEPEGLHLSVSHQAKSERSAKRYPTWDEIADARDSLLPSDKSFVMHLPKSGEYVALHDTTFHLHEEATDRPLRVEIYEAADSLAADYRWRVVHSSNGEIMASGEGYADRRDRDHAVNVLFPGVEIVEIER